MLDHVTVKSVFPHIECRGLVRILQGSFDVPEPGVLPVVDVIVRFTDQAREVFDIRIAAFSQITVEVILAFSGGGGGSPPGWRLVWSDEFNGAAGSAIDGSKWNFDQGGDGWGNNELEFYTNRTDNVRMDGQGDLDHALVRAIGDCRTRRRSRTDGTGARAVDRDAAGIDHARAARRRRQSLQEIERSVEIDATSEPRIAFSKRAGDTREMEDKIEFRTKDLVHDGAIVNPTANPAHATKAVAIPSQTLSHLRVASCRE